MSPETSQPGRGLMEVPRMLLALADKFPGDYTVSRIELDISCPITILCSGWALWSA